MKKIVLLFSGLAAAIAGYSQVSFGVQATGSLASATVESRYDLDYKKDALVRPGAGAVVQYNFSDRFALRSGIGYSQQGAKFWHQEDEFGKTTIRTRLHYIQVPVHAVYYTKGNERLKFFGGLGGYAAYGVGGEAKYTMWHYTDDGGYDVIEKLKAFKSTEDGGGDLKRFDYGASAFAGVQLKNGIFVQAGYQYGLANISREDDDKYHNRGINLTIGYFFKRSK